MKTGVAILISDLKIKIKRDKEGNYIMIKGSIQEDFPFMLLVAFPLLLLILFLCV